MGTRAHVLPRYHPSWLLGEPSHTADNARRRDQLPVNAGPAEPSTWTERPFKGRLGSELRRASSGRGFQSMAPPPWRPPSTYSSPSQPLLHLIVHYIIRKSPVLSSSTGSPSPSIGFRARLQYTIKEAVIFLRASLR
jgi:hypothetical protein